MRSSPCLGVRHHQPSLDPFAEVTDSDVDVVRDELQHEVDLVPEVRYSVER